MTRRIFCKVLLVIVAVFGLLVLSSILSAQGNRDWAFEHVKDVQERNIDRFMAMDGVEGTAIGYNQNDQLAVKVFTAGPGVRGIPQKLDGVPVQVVVTGKIYALVNPTARFSRPVPIGVSTGHPDITAGTIACRVKDSAGNVYALSNNHVYANENLASLGDDVIQPGTFDKGSLPDDYIGTLSDFEPIVFSRRARNEIDAAIAISTVDELGTATPTGGYGTPNSTIVEAFIGQQVQKFGRTTELTTGEVTGVNATVIVGYGPGKTAKFVKQIIIEPGGFSAGGDSGSLIVTDDGNRNPVGLLFAGSSTMTVANRIDLVLTRFGVTVDNTTAGEPPVLTAIEASPNSATIEEGQTQQFTATGSFDDSSTADLTSTATWESSNTAVATVDASGLATGILAGTATITATQDGFSDTASLEVTAPPTLTSILVTPTSATIEKGQTQQFTAMGSFNDGSTADLTSTATWASSNIAVATVDTSGLATGITGILAGTTDITATQDGVPSNAAALNVTPATTTDTVTITKAEYKLRNGELNVEATSTGAPDAVLTVYDSTGAVNYGQMTYDSRKNKYKLKKRGVTDPGESVMVVSSLGGEDTAPVKRR